ncbi:hypothetical protein Afe04nite_20430 [Asanoa ferruginea]|uniref:hypothetical protein n=1 Tax=Asanoa ferruginea TaxID=53367 RepID=UPI001945985A|nr:hypothetical protein [Asanoa ferruginea]GIF47504.1 hypothetical protein Afe04nite_20430 [Asanoa ferruginea]
MPQQSNPNQHALPDLGLPDPPTATTTAEHVLPCPGCRSLLSVGAACTTCVTCRRCRATTPVAHTQATARGSRICDTCLDSFYWRCDSCDGWNRDGDRCGNHCQEDPDDSCDCGYCSDCSPDDDRYPVHSYDYKPRPIFRGTGPLFLGAEIEIETPYNAYNSSAKLAANHLGDLGYLKNDSSIGHGFEIVTHPMSYRWAIANFPWQMLTDLAAAGCDTTDATGIHVHLSRAGFTSPCHTYRWMKFIYRNQRHVTRLAGRSSEQWAAFTSYDRSAAKDYAKGACSERYRAINTGNPDTFELRVFASSLDPAQVQAVLGFAAASVEYTRSLQAHDIVTRNGWEWPSFTGWLDQRPDYQPLLDRIEAPACAF